MTLAALNADLHQVLSDAQLITTRLPGLPELQLWLLDPANLNRAFSSEETRQLLEQPPYWHCRHCLRHGRCASKHCL